MNTDIPNNCPFCESLENVIQITPLSILAWDKFPVSPGHALVIPRRHISSWVDASAEEVKDCLELLRIAQLETSERYSPHGYNIGLNEGRAAGQTVDHVHIHLIPRYEGDVSDPRGGIRHVIPSKANYLL
jgi:diadenosine tetraphosphate (Ap4A) HIT family hydrolase